ncbi:hypothetical protein YC2023_098090 [Brassica napus]
MLCPRVVLSFSPLIVNRHLLMTYLFGDETEEEKKVAEGSEAAKKDTKKPKEKKLVSVGYGIKKLTIIHQARMTKAEKYYFFNRSIQKIFKKLYD